MNIYNVCKAQNQIYSILKQAKENDRLSHAYLFYGDKGTGKKEMAYALSCIIYGANEDFTDSESKTIIDNNHMNVTYIGALENKKLISKDQITELQEEFSKTSFIEGTRIYIVDGIDTASVSAQNSLLKFIEDPANKSQTIGIFIATELSNVVTTIQSRCVLIHFEAIDKKIMIESLVEQGLDDLSARLLSQYTNDIDEAVELSVSDDFIKVKDLFLELIDIKTKKDSVLYYLANQSYFSRDYTLQMLLKFVLTFISDANMDTKDVSNLILSPLCDKIVAYKNTKNIILKDKLKLVLDLHKKLSTNITPKNVFFELMEKFI